MDDYGAADMKNGDLTEAELKGKFNLRGVSVTLDPYTGEKTPTSLLWIISIKTERKSQ